MKKLLLILVLAVMCSSVARADDYKDGLVALGIGDYVTTIKLFRPLAEQGEVDAQVLLGVMYKNGIGVTQDYVFAHMWHNLAAANGLKNGSKSRDIVAKLMTPAQISKAQDMAKECGKKKYKNCE